MFLSTDAGSTGLNPQAASVIVNLDMPWNPAVRAELDDAPDEFGTQAAKKTFERNPW